MMGWEQVPMEAVGTLSCWCFIAYFLGCLTGAVLKTIGTKAE